MLRTDGQRQEVGSIDNSLAHANACELVMWIEKDHVREYRQHNKAHGSGILIGSLLVGCVL